MPPPVPGGGIFHYRRDRVPGHQFAPPASWKYRRGRRQSRAASTCPNAAFTRAHLRFWPWPERPEDPSPGQRTERCPGSEVNQEGGHPEGVPEARTSRRGAARDPHPHGVLGLLVEILEALAPFQGADGGGDSSPRASPEAQPLGKCLAPSGPKKRRDRVPGHQVAPCCNRTPFRAVLMDNTLSAAGPPMGNPEAPDGTSSFAHF